MEFTLPFIPDASSLVTLVRLAEDNLTTARLSLMRLTTDPTVTREQCEQGIHVYTAVADQNDTVTAYLSDNLASGVVPGEAIDDAREALSLLQDTTLLAREIIARAKSRASAPPEIHIPLGNLPEAASLLEQQIHESTRVLDTLRLVAALSVSTLTVDDVRRRIDVNESVLRHLAPLDDQVTSWRKTKLSPAQRKQITAFAGHVRALRKIAHEIIATCRSFQAKALAAEPESASTLRQVFADLIED
jgi:hypothetical protein